MRKMVVVCDHDGTQADAPDQGGNPQGIPLGWMHVSADIFPLGRQSVHVEADLCCTTCREGFMAQWQPVSVDPTTVLIESPHPEMPDDPAPPPEEPPPQEP